MSLRINSWKKVATYTLWIILAALFLTFFLRVAIWEKAYYEEKEGSERAVAAVVPDEREILDETKPTEEEVAEYKVPLGTPRYINIPFFMFYFNWKSVFIVYFHIFVLRNIIRCCIYDNLSISIHPIFDFNSSSV